jgi:hypothetical protein
MKVELSVLILCSVAFFSSQKSSWAECPVVRDEQAIKGKVVKCITALEFLQQKQNELSRDPNYSRMDWEKMTKETFRNAFVITVKVTHRRGFVFACEKFLAEEFTEPISWKESWISQNKKSTPQQYLQVAETCPVTNKEIVFFLDPPCCDTSMSYTGALVCAFDVIPVMLENDIVNMCRKYYSAFKAVNAGEQLVAADASCASSVARFAIH